MNVVPGEHTDIARRTGETASYVELIVAELQLEGGGCRVVLKTSFKLDSQFLPGRQTLHERKR